MKKKTHSFRTRLLSSLLLSVLTITFAMGATVASIYYLYQKNDINDDIKARHLALDESLNSLIDNANFLTVSLFTVDNYHSIDKSSDKEKEFQLLFSQQPVAEQLIKGVTYISETGLELSAVTNSKTNLTEVTESSLTQIINDDNQDYPLRYVSSNYNDSGSFLVLGKKITIDGHNGACFVYLDGKSLMEYVDSIVCLDRNFIVDSKRDIVLSKKQSELGSVIFDTSELGIQYDSFNERVKFQNQDVYVSISTLSSLKESYNLSWQVVSFQDYDELFSIITIMTVVLISLTIIALVTVILFSTLYSHKVSKPLIRFSMELENTDINSIKPYYSSTVEYVGHDEIGQLEHSYHQMIDRIHSLMEENIEKMNEARVLELESLQMQINPHFLYNTLDTISWLAKINNQAEIDSLVMSLAKFFRLTLHSGDKIIKVKEELEITQHYLEIQKMRFPNRFNYSFETDDTIADNNTLKLILQPVVENSVKYAFDPQKGDIQLIIRSRKENNSLIYEVIDNGVGFVVNDDIFKKKKEFSKTKSTGFGLYNVQERIHLEYGEKYGMKIESEVGKGTKTTIVLPLL